MGKSYVDREASNIVFLAHDNAGGDAVKEGSVVPQNLKVGREGEEPEVRGELTNDDGEVVNGQVQVDEHDNEGTDAHVEGH